MNIPIDELDLWLPPVEMPEAPVEMPEEVKNEADKGLNTK